ncbi:MAG: hypothetical protein LBQ51_03035 [Desulfovibrio sp.]|jgi:hypothetical protein|nr:hypothetical protein [Desulfovibrio sp.]
MTRFSPQVKDMRGYGRIPGPAKAADSGQANGKRQHFEIIRIFKSSPQKLS